MRLDTPAISASVLDFANRRYWSAMMADFQSRAEALGFRFEREDVRSQLPQTQHLPSQVRDDLAVFIAVARYRYMRALLENETAFRWAEDELELGGPQVYVDEIIEGLVAYGVRASPPEVFPNEEDLRHQREREARPIERASLEIALS